MHLSIINIGKENPQHENLKITRELKRQYNGMCEGEREREIYKGREDVEEWKDYNTRPHKQY